MCYSFVTLRNDSSTGGVKSGSERDGLISLAFKQLVTVLHTPLSYSIVSYYSIRMITMSVPQAYVIEVAGRSAGIVIADRGGYIFFCSDGDFRSLDRKLFSHVQQAERAANKLLASCSGKKFSHRDIGFHDGVCE